MTQDDYRGVAFHKIAEDLDVYEQCPYGLEDVVLWARDEIKRLREENSRIKDLLWAKGEG